MLRKLGTLGFGMMGEGWADGGFWRMINWGFCSTESSRRWSPKPEFVAGFGGDSGGDCEYRLWKPGDTLLFLSKGPLLALPLMELSANARASSLVQAGTHLRGLGGTLIGFLEDDVGEAAP